MQPRNCATLVVAALLLAACNQETNTTAGTAGSVGSASTTPSSTSPTVNTSNPTTTTSANNLPPRISGSALGQILVGGSYSFTPSASDPEGQPVSFSIANRPAWASFNSATGQLTGTPTSADAGTYSNIVVTASDGRLISSLPAFSIAVVASASGTATVRWAAPSANTDGSALTNLAGYRVRYGTSSTALTKTAQVANPSVSSYTVTNLTPGTWYFSVVSYNSSGLESDPSQAVSMMVL